MLAASAAREMWVGGLPNVLFDSKVPGGESAEAEKVLRGLLEPFGAVQAFAIQKVKKPPNASWALVQFSEVGAAEKAMAVGVTASGAPLFICSRWHQ